MSTLPNSAAIHKGVPPEKSSWWIFAFASSSSAASRYPISGSWGRCRHFSSETKSLSLKAESMFCLCSASSDSSGQYSETTSWTLSESEAKSASSGISREEFSKKILCLNLEMQTLAAKVCQPWLSCLQIRHPGLPASRPRLHLHAKCHIPVVFHRHPTTSEQPSTGACLSESLHSTDNIYVALVGRLHLRVCIEIICSFLWILV